MVAELTKTYYNRVGIVFGNTKIDDYTNNTLHRKNNATQDKDTAQYVQWEIQKDDETRINKINHNGFIKEKEDNGNIIYTKEKNKEPSELGLYHDCHENRNDEPIKKYNHDVEARIKEDEDTILRSRFFINANNDDGRNMIKLKKENKNDNANNIKKEGR